MGMDMSHCDTPNITPSPTWKGSKYGRVFYKGDVSAELRVTVLNNDENLEVRDAQYYGLLMFGKKKCGSKFLDALATGATGVDIQDLEHSTTLSMCTNVTTSKLQQLLCSICSTLL